jgi:hypothetical protein
VFTKRMLRRPRSTSGSSLASADQDVSQLRVQTARLPSEATFFTCAVLLHPLRQTMPSFPQLSPTRLRSYVFRLPLTTRLLLAAILGLWAAAIPLPWVREVAALTPDKFDFTQSMWCLFVCVHGQRMDAEVDAAEDRGGLRMRLPGRKWILGNRGRREPTTRLLLSFFWDYIY